jgi:hypothetical protein
VSRIRHDGGAGGAVLAARPFATRSFREPYRGIAVDAPSTICYPEHDMSTFRKLGCLLGLVIGMTAASTASAQSYPDPYNDRDDSRYDDRNDNRSDDQNGYYDQQDQRYDERYDGRYRRVVVCESQDRHTSYCNADTRGEIRLVRQLSDRRCVRGSTWGTNQRGIWVTDGCRAEFEVQGYQRYGETVRCESNDNRTHYCNADTRYGVRLWRQLSRKDCREGYTWGVSRNRIWVSRGCRADFRVGDRGGARD